VSRDGDAGELRLYFDFSCPWSYLAPVRLQDGADRHGMDIKLRPVLVDRVLATEKPAAQARRLAGNPAKEAWQRKDLQDWAKMWGIAIEIPAEWPCDPALAAAGAAVAPPSGAGIDYCLNVFRAYFSAGADITNPDVLANCAADAGIAEAEFREALKQTGPHEQVADWTQELVRQGGFGTPSMFVGDELFFGKDRIPLVDWRISPISDATFVMPGQHG